MCNRNSNGASPSTTSMSFSQSKRAPLVHGSKGFNSITTTSIPPLNKKRSVITRGERRGSGEEVREEGEERGILLFRWYDAQINHVKLQWYSRSILNQHQLYQEKKGRRMGRRRRKGYCTTCSWKEKMACLMASWCFTT